LSSYLLDTTLDIGLIRLPERKFDENGKATRGGSGIECLIEVLPLDDRLLEKLRGEIPQAKRKSRDNAWRAVARRNIVAPREHKTPQEYCPPIRMETQHPNAEVSLQSNAEVALQSNAEVAAPFLNTNSNLSVDNVGVGSAVVDRPAAQPDDDERDNTERTAESEVAPPPRPTTPGTMQALARSGTIPASAPELGASREAEICTVVTTLLRFGGGDDEIARRLLTACRMNAPECSAQDVAGAIIFKAASVDLNQIRNTSGFFAVTVPKLFTGETWRQIRADGAPQRPPILSPHAETVLRCMRRMQERDGEEIYFCCGV
jgi:hypothetical protein